VTNSSNCGFDNPSAPKNLTGLQDQEIGMRPSVSGQQPTIRQEVPEITNIEYQYQIIFWTYHSEA
jgi:hypothetical protein